MAQSQKNAQLDVDAATFPLLTTEENDTKETPAKWGGIVEIIEDYWKPAESKTLLESGTKIETLLENWRMNRQNRRILLEIRDQTDE